MTGPVGGAGELNLRVCLECEQHRSGDTCTNCGAIWFNERWVKVPSLIEAGNLLAYWYHVRCHDGNAANMAKCKHDGCIDWQAALAAKAPQGVLSERDCTRREGLYLKFSDRGLSVDQNTPVIIERVNGDCSVSEFIIARDEAYKLPEQLRNFLGLAAPSAPGAERRSTAAKIAREICNYRGPETVASQVERATKLIEEALAAAPPAPEGPTLEEEQAAHERIASLCFAAGAESPDGTSVGAVKDLIRLGHASAERVRQLVAAWDHNSCQLGNCFSMNHTRCGHDSPHARACHRCKIEKLLPHA